MFTCPVCGMRGFYSQEQLDQHIKDIHGTAMPGPWQTATGH